jgi:hypothetical protein
MPSARTSVGNKEYEYKGKKERAAKLQQPGNRQKAAGFGDAAVVAALRHVIERKPCVCGLSTVFFMTKTPKRPNPFRRLSIQTEIPVRSFAHCAYAKR